MACRQSIHSAAIVPHEVIGDVAPWLALCLSMHKPTVWGLGEFQNYERLEVRSEKLNDEKRKGHPQWLLDLLFND